MKSRLLPRLSAPTILLALALATTAGGQWLADSIDVGAFPVSDLLYNPVLDLVYGCIGLQDGIFFVIDCATNQVIESRTQQSPGVFAYDSTDNKLYLTTHSGDYDTVLVLDGTTFQPVARIPLWWVSVPLWDSDRNRVYVTCPDDNEVAVIDCTTDSVIATVRVGRWPGTMQMNSRHDRLYVLNHDGESVSIVDLEALEEVEEIRLGGVPQCGLYSEAAGKFYCGGTWSVTVIDGAGDSVVAAVPLPYYGLAYSLAENPEAEVVVAGVFATTYCLCAISTRSDTMLTILQCPREPLRIKWSPYTRQLYAACGAGVVAVVNSDGSAVVAEVPVQNCPCCMALSPRQHRLYVGHLNSRLVYVLRDQSIGVEEPAGEPAPTVQLRAWPSPFRRTLMVACDGEGPCRVFGADGRLVRTLPFRNGQCRWDGRDNRGVLVPPGAYLLAVAGAGACRARVVKF